MPRPLFQYHPRIGYTYIPGIKARIVNRDSAYRIRVNEQGFRCNHDFSVQDKKGPRILLFGDSFSAGDGVSNEERFSDLLEEKFASIALQIYNYAIPGTGTDQQYLTYLDFATGVDHDLLILGILVENIRRITTRFRLYTSETGELLAYAKPFFELQGKKLVLRNTPVPKFPVKIADIPAEERQFIQPDGRFSLLKPFLNEDAASRVETSGARYPHIAEYDRVDHSAWLLMKSILMEWISAARAPVLLIPIPYYPFVEGLSDPAPYQERFRELAEESRCLLHDPLPDFMKYPVSDRRRFRFPVDFHLSPLGHAALADSLARKIRERGWID